MIYINGRFLEQKLTGVQRFAKEISIQLSSLRSDVTVLVSNLDKVEDKSIGELLNLEELKGFEGHLWEQITLPNYLKKIKNPLLINLTSTAPIRYKNKISTHHDITYVRYPESFSYKFRLLYKFLIPEILRSSKKIITVSEFSKNEICNYYDIKDEKVRVLYNAVSKVFEGDFSCNDNLNKPYMLAVSSPNYHKNFLGLMAAFSELNMDIELKIIGSLSSSFNKIDYELNNDSRVKFLGRISDEELASLYQHALCFAFPSFYEGFGIPPLEAQSKGCPVISSKSASMPEVLGNSVLYFDAEDKDDMKNAIQEIFSNEPLRTQLIDLGYKNVMRFSWLDSASKLNDMINEP